MKMPEIAVCSESRESTSFSDCDVADKIEKLRNLIKTDDHVQNLRQEDAYLLRFLYFCEFDVDAAFKMMQAYCEWLFAHPEWFSTKGPNDMKYLLEENIRIMSPHKDKDGRHIYICKIGNINPSTMPMNEVVCLDQTYLELIMDEPETMEKGICVIVDLQGYSWKIFRWLTPNNLKISTRLLDIYPIKTYKLHIVNTSMLVNVSVKLMWPFLSKRIKEMVIFHFEDWPSLHEHVAPEALPPDYGGSANLDYESCYKTLYARNSEIEEKLKHHELKL